MITLLKSGLAITPFSIFFLLAETEGRAQGNFVYINEGPLVESFSFAASGAFAPVPGSPFPTSGFGDAIATFPAAKHISKSGPLFDMCVSDLFTGDQVQFNSRTGDYRYANCHTGISLVGRGSVSGSGCPVTLNDPSPNHKVSIAACGASGSALVRSAALGINASFSGSTGKCGCD